MVTLHSALYTGTVEHQRWRPKPHHLSYPVYMVYSDLDELDAIAEQHPLWSVGRRNLVWFKRADYFGDAQTPLKQALLTFMQERTGYRPTGAVRMLTQWRTWGVGFSPVTFYYLFDAGDDETPVAIIPEITNTPWHDRYQYVLTTRPLPGAVMTDGLIDGQWRFAVDKAFHVSPFHPMDHHYQWHFGVPNDRVSMYLQNDDSEGKIFVAWMGLERVAVNRRNLGLVLKQYPVMTWRVLWGIYSHALRLWVKQVPFHRRPPGGVK